MAAVQHTDGAVAGPGPGCSPSLALVPPGTATAVASTSLGGAHGAGDDWASVGDRERTAVISSRREDET